MKVSIIIPLGNGSRWNNTELRYALRSIERYLSGYAEVFIIGECPSFLNNIIHIPAKDGDKTYEKERNIFNKIMVACNDTRVTDDFLFMNDDHFLLHDYEVNNFPYYFDGKLRDVLTVTDYRHTLNNTISLLGGHVSYFDVHAPIVYNKTKFASLAHYDWAVRFGYCIKTMYCTLSGITGTQQHDLKIKDPLKAMQIKKLIEGQPWFSIDNGAREGEMLEVLQEFYPIKSRYEK